MAESTRPTASTVLVVCALLSFAMLAAVETAQHVFGIEPCSWCVLQRLILLVAGVVCAIGAAIGARAGRLVAILVADVLAMAGFASALYLHLVASRSESCVATFADRVIMALSLHEIAPWMFMPYAPCNEANPPLLGVPLALWAAIGFMGLSLLLGYALVRSLREAR